MCLSRLHRVVSGPDAGFVEVDDLDGARHRVSLLAYDGPVPAPGDWVVAHSGFALGPVEAAEAEAVVAELGVGRDLEARPAAPGSPA